jgi:hypothetical protein
MLVKQGLLMSAPVGRQLRQINTTVKVGSVTQPIAVRQALCLGMLTAGNLFPGFARGA